MSATIQNNDLAEEVEAINAIYDPDTITVSSAATSKTSNSTLDLGSSTPSAVETTAKLQLPNDANLSFVIGFEASYPDSPPRVLGTASTGVRGEGKVAVDVVRDIIQRVHQPGAVCLFDVINEAVEAFDELNLGGSQEEAVVTEDDAAESTDLNSTSEKMATLSLRDVFGLDREPEWVLSDVMTEKKSVFLGRAAPVTSLPQLQGFLDHLVATDKKAAAATHNISAWRIRPQQESGERGETTVQDFDDDGETAAGGRLLHLMQLMDVWNVVVVVSRGMGESSWDRIGFA